MKHGLKVWLGIALGAAIAIFGAIDPAAADRPGTPNNLTAYDCSVDMYEDGTEQVCGVFKSTSTEEVTYDSEITENGKPAAPGLIMGCQKKPPQYPPPACVIFGTKHDHQAVEYNIRRAKFDTDYCVRFRARRVSDQMVSDLWSNQACVHTAPLPPPRKPTIAVRYLAPAPDTQGDMTPPEVEITFDQVSNATDQQVHFTPNGAVPKGKGYNGVWIYRVPPAVPDRSDDILTISVCDTNPGGKLCTTRVIDTTAQRDVQIDGALPIKVTGGPPGQPLSPRPTSGFDGMWNVTTDQQTAFTMNMMLVNGAKMGAFTTTPDPADKLDMSGRLIDPTHAEFSFKEPGHIVFGTAVVTGTLGITLSNDGKSFIAIAQYSNNTTNVWRGTKTTPAPAR